MYRIIVLLILVVGVSAPALSQTGAGASANDLLKKLRAEIAEFKETGAILEENARAARENSAKADALRRQDQNLASRSSAYDKDVAGHNSEVAAYTQKCLNGKLPEDLYTQCLTAKQNLDLQKARLDGEGDKLEADHAAYNQAVRDLNTGESARADAAAQLLSRYEALDQSIRELQVRLYDIAVGEDQNGFAEQVRQCTKQDSLDAVYTCMAAAFRR